MKSMLYVGASLMIGASIYGFVDYKQTHNKKEFTEMYKESKHEPVVADKPAEVIEKKTDAAPVKTAAVTKRKSPSKKTAVAETVPAIKPISEDEKISTKEPVSIEESKVEVKTTPVTAVKKTKKKKKLDHKIFSRAPLREEFEEEEVVPEKEKKTVVSKEE